MPTFNAISVEKLARLIGTKSVPLIIDVREGTTADRIDVLPACAYQSRHGRRHERVACVEQRLRRRAPHEPVADQHAERRRGGSDAGRQHQHSDQAGQRAEVDLLLRTDLDREPLRQHDAGDASRNENPPPRLHNTGIPIP